HHDELSCIAIDIDHFKAVNDRHGHAGGDAVLVAIARICTQELRQTDPVGRLGGEEFAVLLPNTGLANAVEGSEKLRQAIERTPIDVGGESITVTVSLGVAALDQATRDFDALLKNADNALYLAKQTGRNRTVASQPAEPPIRPTGRRVLKGG